MKATRLDRVATVQARIGWKALTASEYEDDGYAFLATPNIKPRDIDFQNVNYISQYRYDESPELKLAIGDVLLAKDGSTLGIVNVVRDLPRPSTVNGSIAVLRPFDIEPRFLGYWLQGAAIQSLIAQVKDGMGVPHLFQKDIRKFPIPEIEIADQRRIADFLDDRIARIDEVSAAHRRQLDELCVFAAESAQEATTLGGTIETRDTGIPWMPSVSRSWDLPRISHVFRTGSGTTPTSTDESYFDGGVPWVTTTDVRDRKLRSTTKTVTAKALNDFSTLVRYEPGSLVVAMYGQGATKGRVAILETSACVNQACCVLTGVDQDITEWAFYWFKAHKPAIVQLALGAGQPNLSQDIIRSLRLPMPPSFARRSLIEEMKNREAEVGDLIQSTTEQVRLLNEYKQSLITATVNGEFDVTSASTEGPA
ncbi:restriction endonuclease subunit S [Nocardioides humilatus]|uniref:Restriction endonuclease subunit S n=1 Tax=Nocardioides humilatus TaxID=2607660 RepID=A0A5B1L3Y1_9ACTN|nr:restriction endonuclease subunit S [Nocardioides humilatus]KAA1415352.1 restriction endonuclease subunit S [Nocardioides humilatus]